MREQKKADKKKGAVETVGGKGKQRKRNKPKQQAVVPVK